MANALANTIFAQRMALREKLLNQAREDKMIEDDRKVKLIAEMNRSTDLALQAQAKAMERKRQDAKVLAEAAAFRGEPPPVLDEADSIQDALAVGTAVGGGSRVKLEDEQDQAYLLKYMQEEGASNRAAAQREVAKRGQDLNQGRWEDPVAKRLREAQAKRMSYEALESEVEAEKEARLIESQIHRNLHPLGGITILPNLKEKSLTRFAKLEAQYPTAFSKTTTFGSVAEKTVNQIIRDKVNAAREKASREYDAAAGREIDDRLGHQAGEFAIQAVYDELMQDPEFLGAMQQMPKLTPFAPTPSLTPAAPPAGVKPKDPRAY